MKYFLFFINSIYWLWAFSVPVIVCGIPGIMLYDRSPSNIPYTIILLIIGTITGFIIAERIRKKTGLIKFFGTISDSPDVVDRNTRISDTDSKES